MSRTESQQRKQPPVDLESRPPDERSGKEQTQARILRAAAELFAERAYHATSITAVAERAGVSRGAIFWHFADKASLFREVCRSATEPFIRKLDESLEGLDPRKKIFEMFSVYEGFAAGHGDTVRIFLRWFFDSPDEASAPRQALLELHDRFCDELRDCIEAVVGDRGEASALAAGLVAQMDGGLLLLLLDEDPVRRERRAAGLRALAEAALPRR